ncbi:uncharacterized protein TNCV_494371 [Trichonephila clavipes]|nr:uncharacterized protein TNCV_494371 [Trichonephila clavipes]
MNTTPFFHLPHYPDMKNFNSSRWNEHTPYNITGFINTRTNSTETMLGLLGNEVEDDLAKAVASNPVDPEDHMVLRATEIYSKAKDLICRTWVIPPVHPCTFCHVWGFPVRRLLHPPAVLRLCTDLWTHGSGLPQMGINPSTTTTFFKEEKGKQLLGPYLLQNFV